VELKEFEVTINTLEGEYEHLNKQSLEKEFEYSRPESNATNSMRS
jgi:hypothetical protein